MSGLLLGRAIQRRTDQELMREAEERTQLMLNAMPLCCNLWDTDLPHLFGEFVQLDARKNKGVESTGLGLSITKHLCHSMGGSITATSVYGQGSVFTVTLPQKFVGSNKLASVPNPQDFRVLLYEPRTVYATSMCTALDELGVASTLVANQTKLFEAFHENYSHIFLPSFLFETCYNELKSLQILNNVVVCAEYGEKLRHSNVNVVSMPLHTFTIANILNKNIDFSYDEGPKTHARFVAPAARVLVVDDIRTNLKVAEGLMTSYGMQIDTCESGKEAIDLVQANNYDLVFMDHMMPGMDGMETTQIIRELPAGRELPIIALTANAVAGAKEMFLDNNFDDFLAKPIDITNLNEILDRWVPKKKQQKIVGEEKTVAAPTFEIAGIDTRYGIAMTGGSEANYLKVLTAFYKDGSNKLSEIPESLAADDLPLYTTYTHSLKSALGSIGALYLSGCAAKLELAGKNNDQTYIEGANEIFLQDLIILLDNISAVIGMNTEPAKESLSEEHFRAHLLLLKKALDDMDAVAMDNILSVLQTGTVDSARTAPLERLVQHVLLCDYDEAEVLIADLLAQSNSVQD